jgi:hypothetical protein
VGLGLAAVHNPDRQQILTSQPRPVGWLSQSWAEL